MSIEDNKALVRRFFEDCVNNKDLDAGEKLLASDFVGHFAGLPEPIQGVEAFRQLGGAYFAAFPDLHLTIEDAVTEGDKVVCFTSWRGTQHGEFMGMPPTGKQVAVRGLSAWRIANGRLAEHWDYQDTLSLLQQLGAIPVPEQARE